MVTCWVSDLHKVKPFLATISIPFWVTFCKKRPLSLCIWGMLWAGQWMSEWASEWWVRDVCMSHQLNWIYYKQPNINFLVFVAGKCNKIFLFQLLVSNVSLTLLLFMDKWLQLKSDSCSHGQNRQTRSQSSHTSTKMFGPIFS